MEIIRGVESFLQDGSNARFRTLREKARDVVHIEDFVDADPTGQNDSYAAIMAAFQQAATFKSEGTVIELGSGVYACSDTIVFDTSGAGLAPNHVTLRGKGMWNTALIHVGTQTTGCFVAETEVLWNGVFYGQTNNGFVTLEDLSFGSNYGPAVHFKMVGFVWRHIRGLSAGLTSANFIISGGGGDMWGVFLDHSGGNYSNEFADMYQAALPLGDVSFPDNMLRISTGTYNDGTNGANSGALNRVTMYGCQGYGAVTGYSVLIAPDNAAYAEKPARIYMEGCQFACAAGCPAPMKIDGATQVEMALCQFEPGTSNINIEMDTYLGNTDVTLIGCEGWGGTTGTADAFKISDTAARPAGNRLSLRMSMCKAQEIRLNTTVLAAGKLADLELQNVLCAVDCATFSSAPANVANYSVFGVNWMPTATTRTAVTNGNTRNTADHAITLGSMIAPAFRLYGAGSRYWGLAADGTFIQFGAGTPEGAVTAPIGSLYIRNNGAAGSTLYVKQSGSGNTGWVGTAPIDAPNFTGVSTFASDVTVSSGSMVAPALRLTGSILHGPPGDGTGPVMRFGTGSPETNFAHPVGSIYMRTDGGASTTMYVKESGTGTTGWRAV